MFNFLKELWQSVVQTFSDCFRSRERELAKTIIDTNRPSEASLSIPKRFKDIKVGFTVQYHEMSNFHVGRLQAREETEAFIRGNFPKHVKEVIIAEASGVNHLVKRYTNVSR